MAPAPNRYHQDISRNLEFILLNYLKECPLGVLYDAPFDVYLTETDVFQPDIVVVFNANLRLLTDAGCEGPPDFVVKFCRRVPVAWIWKIKGGFTPDSA